MSENEGREKNMIRQTEKYIETKRILQSLFDNAVISGNKRGAFLPTRYETFVENCKDFYDKWQESHEISEILRDMKSEVVYNNDKLKSMSKMLAYLGLVESLGVTLTDMVLILFIANGIDVHTRGPFTKHVKSFKELKDIDLKYKTDFLKDESLNLFQSFPNQEVRNIIAHLKFRIGNNGQIMKPDGSELNIDDEISKFWDDVDLLKLVFEDIGFMRWLELKKQGVKTYA